MVAYTAQQIVDLVNAGKGPADMYTGHDVASKLSALHIEIAGDMKSLQQDMVPNWKGDAAGQAYAGAAPLIQASEVSGQHLAAVQNLYQGQGSSFADLHSKVAAVNLGTKPSDDWVSDTPFSFLSNRADEISDYNAKSQQVVDTYNVYHGQSTDNSGQWPAQANYGALGAAGDASLVKPVVPGEDTGGNGNVSHISSVSGHGGTGGHNGGGPSGGPVNSGGPGGSNGGNPGRGPVSHGGPGSGSSPNPSGNPGNLPNGTSTSGYVPPSSTPGNGGLGFGVPGSGGGNAGADSGFGPTGGFAGGFGPGGGSSYGSGGGFGPGSGGSGSSSGARGNLAAGNSSGAGGAESESAGGRATGGPSSSAGRPGASGTSAGGMGRGGKGEGDEDTEHHRPAYLLENDPDSALIGELPRTSPPVIGL